MVRVVKKVCRDCALGSKRPAPHPGPRCATHHREHKARQRRAAWARHIEKTYGITVVEYDRILEEQKGACAICTRATGATRRLAVDHDHTSGLVRGVLCRPCNKMLGHGRDDPEFFERAAAYLTAPPALAAGIERYVPDCME